MSAHMDEPALSSMDPKEIILRFTHQTDKAAYYKKDDRYSPTDISRRFAGSSPHTLVSSSSSSSHRNSPDEQAPQCQDVDGPPRTIDIAALHYNSDSPVSSLRSEDDHTAELTAQTVRVKRRKQNKPVKHDADHQDLLEVSRVPDLQRAATMGYPSAGMFADDQTDDVEPGQLAREDGERMDEVSTSVSSPGSVSPGQRLDNFGGGRVFPTGPTGVKIFNPDAYCDLCDKEFCNKYFLKTHKANRHHVYEASPPSAVSPLPRTAEDDNAVSARPTTQLGEIQLKDSLFGMSFHQPNPFLTGQSVSTGSSRDGSKKSSTKNIPEPPAQSSYQTATAASSNEAESHALHQSILHMYAQNMALQQLYRNQGMAFPGLLPMPAGMLHHPLQQPNNMMAFLRPQLAPMMMSWPTDHHHLLHDNSPIPPDSQSVQPPHFLQEKNKEMSERRSYDDDVNVCDVCHKRLSSHNFLKIHRRKKHGIEEPVKVKLETELDGALSGALPASQDTTDAVDLSRPAQPASSIGSSSQGVSGSSSRIETDGLPRPAKKRRQSKKKAAMALERDLMERTAQINLRESREKSERPSSTTTIEASHGYQTPPMMVRQFTGLTGAGGQPMQLANLQRLLQFPESVRDPRTGHRETFRCSVCLMDFATRFYLESHCIKSQHYQSPVCAAYETNEATVLDLSTPKSRSRRTGENLPPPPPALAQRHSKSSPNKLSPRKRSIPSSPFRGAVDRGSEDFHRGDDGSAEEGMVVGPGGGSGGLDLECYCTKCSREYCSKYFLRTHLKKEHQMTTEQYLEEVRLVYPDVWQQYMTPPGGMDAVGCASMDTASGSGSRRNWCRYCKKDFCNKYFFKTHMEKMHNEVVSPVTSQRGTKKRSKSVPCDICGKPLCSKYFLRIHKRNTHGIIDPSLDTGSSAGGSSPSFLAAAASSSHRLPSFAGSFTGEEDVDMLTMPGLSQVKFEEEGDDDEEMALSSRLSVAVADRTQSPSPASLAVSSGLGDEEEEEGLLSRSVSPAVSLQSQQPEEWDLAASDEHDDEQLSS